MSLRWNVQRPRPEPAEPRTDIRLAFWLGRLRVGDPRDSGSLRIHPLVWEGDAGKPFTLLHEALRAGTFEVHEHGPGSVNEVIAVNRGADPVLIVEGESIVGAKQNRVVVRTVLVGAGDSVQIPVGCIQQGRWSPGAGKFDIAPAMVEPTIRRSTVREAHTLGHVDQGRLWAAVAEKLGKVGVRSSTGDYQEGVAREEQGAKRRAREFENVPGQVGILALVGGGLLGLELVGHPDTWNALAHRLVPSYVLAASDGVSWPAPAGGAPARTAEEWIAEIARAGMRLGPARGLGTEFALAGSGFAGAGLWYDGRPAHLAVFAE